MTLHVLLVNRWFPPHSGFGGVAMYNYYLSRALVRLGHRVTVISSRWSPDAQACEHIDGVKVIRLLLRHRAWLHRLPGIGRYMRGLVETDYSIRAAQAIRAVHRRDPADVVEFAEIGAEGFSYLKSARRLPVVVRCHTPTAVLVQHYLPAEIPYSTHWTQAKEKYCVHAAEGLTAPSLDMARTAARIFTLERKAIRVIPNPIDVNTFCPSEGRVPTPESSGITILHVGRLERVKGIQVLAEAMPKIVEQVPTVRFVFIGEDRRDPTDGQSWQEKIGKWAQTAGIPCSFPGEVNLTDLVQWYHRSDIACVPTLNYESFSYTTAQAMAAGLPVIASNIGAIPETIGDEDAGIVLPPGDSNVLAEAVITLARDMERRLRIGSTAQARARRFFDSIVIAQRMVSEVYQPIMESRR